MMKGETLYSSDINDQTRLETVLDQVHKWSEREGYKGFNKHDGLNSPLLSVLLGWHKWLRLIAIQSVMRFPVNLRPCLLIPKTYNPKGLALFSRSYLDRYKFTDNIEYLNKAEHLLDLLINLRVERSKDCFAWGYLYPWQDPGFFAPANTPNAVVTAFVCEAFLDAYEVTGKHKYLDIVNDSIRFFLQDLAVLKKTDQELCLSYMPLAMTMRVMDVSILIGTVIAQFAKIKEDNNLAATARRLVTYVVNQQTDYHAWYYTDPPADSHITHDNYHTGFILDALWNYMQVTGDNQWENNYWRGLDFYAQHHFNESGAPRWMHDTEYPHDIHGAAQGILTFSRHQSKFPGFASTIANWAIENMYDRNGRFYYQETRYYKKKFTLLRWCNAWMARSISRLMLETKVYETN